MSGSLNTFWSEIGPLWRWSRPLPMVDNPDFLALERLGFLVRTSISKGDPWPCVENSGCCRRVVFEDEQGVAVCSRWPNECREQSFPMQNAYLLSMSLVGATCSLQTLLELDPRPIDNGSWVFVGERLFGQRRVSFLLPRFPSSPDLQDLRSRINEDPDRVLVLIVPHRRCIPGDAPRKIGNTELEWLPLGEILRPDCEALDLSSLVLNHSFPGFDVGRWLWPRYSLVIDGDRVWCFGDRLLLERSPLERQFLLFLASAPDHRRTRRELLLEIWPESFSSRTMEPRDSVSLDRRLRQLKSDLCATLEAIRPGAGAIVENVRGRSDTEGGYLLKLDSSEICFLRTTT